jgi:hypothetical protein
MIYNLISSEVILLVEVYDVVNFICPVGREGGNMFTESTESAFHFSNHIPHLLRWLWHFVPKSDQRRKSNYMFKIFIQ